VLDLASVSPDGTAKEALHETVRTAETADRLGYLRFWVAEHHASPWSAGSSPAVLIAYIAARTHRIRVGSGGVMLTNYAPFVIAEQFAVIQALNEGRVDLGLGRASGGVTQDAPIDQALRRAANSRSQFPALVDELAGFLHHEWPQEDHMFRGLELSPQVAAPNLFVLGVSQNGAEVAAERGLPFVYGYHLGAKKCQSAAPAYYRAAFTPNSRGEKPYTIASVNVVCAQNERTAIAAARAAAREAVRRNRAEMHAEQHLTRARESYLVELALKEARVIHGDAGTVCADLDRLASRLGVDEVMLVPFDLEAEGRRRTLQLIAEAWQPAS
jgi:luciferase family oxidoreductase group 1